MGGGGSRYGLGSLFRRTLIAILTAAALAALAVLPVPLGAQASETAAASAESASTESSNPIDDQGSSFKYRSYITSVTPKVTGLSFQVLQFADRLLMINHTGKTVTIYGYEGEPYARVLPNGAAEQNIRSSATYLNRSFYGDVNVPPQAQNPHATPSWQVIDRTGQLEWHDHRIHFTSPAIPPQVKDKSKRTLIFDWKIPIEVGTQRGAIAGQLYWVPESSKASTAVIVLGVAIALGGLILVLIVRRRRRASPAGPAPADGAPGKEAW